VRGNRFTKNLLAEMTDDAVGKIGGVFFDDSRPHPSRGGGGEEDTLAMRSRRFEWNREQWEDKGNRGWEK
jgi:hypothetical protein